MKGESSTAYTKYPHISGVPRRIFRKCPDAKFIYLLRHPIDRTVSHIIHDMLEGLAPQLNFVDGLIRQKENNIYVDCSRYMMQIDQYLNYFPKDRFLLVSHFDLKTNPALVVNQVQEFLGIEGDLNSEVFHQKKNVSGERTIIEDRALYKLTLKQEKRGEIPIGTAEKLRKPFVAPGITEVAAVDLMDDLKPDIERLYEFAGRDFDWTV